MIETLRSLARAAGHPDLPVPARRPAPAAALAYEGVRSARRQGGWVTTGKSGNAEIGPALAKLRENAHDLARNNAYGKKAVREWPKRVVGYGITPQADTGDEALNAVIDGYWAQWIGACMSDKRMGFYAAEKLVVRTAFESGECLVRLWDRPLEDNLPVPFQIQLLEPDYLDQAKTQSFADGSYIIHGVQFDGIGRIQGYWLFGQHPGDVTITSARGALTSKFISADVILHHCEIERPGDVRAVSRFAAVMAKLRDIDEYADAVIVKAKGEACIVGAVTQPEGPDGPTLGGVVTDSNGNRVETLQPGVIVYTPAGAGIEFNAPTGTADFAAHKKCELREVATGFDIPYVVLDDNLEAVNYSSYRGGLLAYRDTIEEYRWNWLIPQVLDPIWRKFINVLVMMGAISERLYGVKWNPPPFDLLDRGAEAEADRAELQIGKKTWPQLQGDQGNDPKKQLAEIARWRPLLEAAGVTYARTTAESKTESDTGDPSGKTTSPAA